MSSLEENPTVDSQWEYSLNVPSGAQSGGYDVLMAYRHIDALHRVRSIADWHIIPSHIPAMELPMGCPLMNYLASAATLKD